MARKTQEQLRKEYDRKVLRIYKGKKLLTQIEGARVLAKLTKEHVELLSKGMPPEIRGRCEMHDGIYVGQGTCIALKYLKLSPSITNGCGYCKSQEIVNQLNYIFEKAFEGEYIAEWGSKKQYRKRKTI